MNYLNQIELEKLKNLINFLTIGKEYELNFNNPLLWEKHTHANESGSVTTATPIYKLLKFEEIIAYEKALQKLISKNVLFDFYKKNNNIIKKGCHFHIGVKDDNYKIIETLPAAIWLTLNTQFKKLLTRQQFRSTIKKWAKMNAYKIINSYNYDKQSYTAIIINNRYYTNEITTVDLRASEYSVIGDIAFLLISLILYIKINNKINLFDLPKLGKLCEIDEIPNNNAVKNFFTKTATNFNVDIAANANELLDIVIEAYKKIKFNAAYKLLKNIKEWYYNKSDFTKIIYFVYKDIDITTYKKAIKNIINTIYNIDL